MSEQQDVISKAFRAWKIWLAVLLGLGFASFMIYSSLSGVHYVKVGEKTGTHRWVDSNHNQRVDANLAKEFVKSDEGIYRQQQVTESLGELVWDQKALFWMLMAILCMFGRDLAYMWRIKVLTKNKLTWRRSLNVILLWEFASALSPGVVSGAAVAMFILNREKIPLGKSTAIVVVTAMMDNLFYVLLIPLVFLFVSPALLFPANSGFEIGVEVVFWIGFAVFFTLCVLLFLSIFFYPKLIRNFLAFVFRFSLLKKWREKAIQTGEDVMLTSIELKQEGFFFWFKSFLATMISWTSRYLVINCILAAFLKINFFDHFFILGKQLVLWLFMRISPTPGASGIAEYAFGELMQDFGGSMFLLTALAVLWRLISYFPYLIIGAFILPRWLKKTSN